MDAVMVSVSVVSSRPGARLIRAGWRLHARRGTREPGGSALVQPGPGADLRATLRETQDRVEVEAALDGARRAGEAALAAAGRINTRPLVWGHPGYPAFLAAIPDPPAVVWVRGQSEALERPLVAVVGARHASAAALEMAEHLSADLAVSGIGTVSGMARGVDGAAHRGALAAAGTTVAVLGCGTDIVYPPEHAGLQRDILLHGAVVSELPPGTEPRPPHFPLRNRIISGLAAGVVVVEAGERSGSLITARAALDQGREVMAVPGSALGGRSRGCHALIKDGAALVEHAGDVLAALEEWQLFRAWVRRSGPAAVAADPLLARMEPGEPYDLDSLAAETTLDPVALLPRLLAFELSGVIRRDAAGRFVRALGLR